MTMLSTSRRRCRPGAATAEINAAWAPAEDWSALSVGSYADVATPEQHPYVGRVDAKTPDSSIVWAISAGQARRMFGHRDGVRLQTAGGTA
ncbi:hypothetical protein ABIB51_000244 [Arthrobacter sp. UYCu712]